MICGMVYRGQRSKRSFLTKSAIIDKKRHYYAIFLHFINSIDIGTGACHCCVVELSHNTTLWDGLDVKGQKKIPYGGNGLLFQFLAFPAREYVSISFYLVDASWIGVNLVQQHISEIFSDQPPQMLEFFFCPYVTSYITVSVCKPHEPFFSSPNEASNTSKITTEVAIRVVCILEWKML